MIEMNAVRGVRDERFDHDIEMSAAGQAELLGLLLGFAVAEELRPVLGKFATGQFREQIVLDAAAGQRALEIAVAVAGE